MVGDNSARNVVRRDGTPLHHQISAVLRSSILSGRYGEGDYLPAEMALVEAYGVSRATIRRALETLADEGLIDRQAGKGTRVTGTGLRVELEERRRAAEEGARGTEVAVINVGDALTPPDAAAALDLAAGTRTLQVTRLRTSDGLPLRYLTAYLPVDIGEQVARHDLSNATLLSALEAAGTLIDSARDEVGATLADPLSARLLEVRVGDPLLEIASTMFDPKGRAIAFQRTLVPPSRFKVRLQLRAAHHGIRPLSEYAAIAPIEDPHSPTTEGPDRDGN